MVKRWHGQDFHHEWLVQQNVWQGCSFLWIWQRFKTSGNITRLFTYVSIKIMIMHCGSSSFLQFWPVLLHCWNPFQLAAQLPATLAQSAALPQASHEAPLLALHNSSCSPSSSVTVDTKTAFVPQPSEPLFIHDLRICAANDCSRGQPATHNLPPVIPNSRWWHRAGCWSWAS